MFEKLLLSECILIFQSELSPEDELEQRGNNAI